MALFIVWGLVVSPFGTKDSILPSHPVSVDAIPDIGENQQIVYTEWAGISPQDIDDQVTYPLTTALLGIPGVKTIRSNSIFGLSGIYIIFEDDIEFYWSRSRILEKLNSLPSNLLPDGVVPTLGPDATALGQIFWYTLEGRDENGKPTGGWDPQELRTIQDYYVRYALSSAKGIAEVASIGGFIQEYQIDIDPDAMKYFGISESQLIKAVKDSNLDVGARTIEYNRVEYMIRSLGYVQSVEDLEESVVISRNNVPIRIKDVAKVNIGPATRRGGLDKNGVEAVGGVVVTRYAYNPMEAIENIKDKIEEITPGLPSKVLKDGSVSKLAIVPFYDRTGLIKETLGTLEEALTLEVLICLIVVIVMVFNLRLSLIISSILPVGVLMSFILLSVFGMDANILALSGIAIAIGVMVDVGIVFSENVLQGINKNQITHSKTDMLKNIFESFKEVAPAVITSIATTIVSFFPVFFLQAQEGKMFSPLAYTKTFAMISALILGLAFLPTLSYYVFSFKFNGKKARVIFGLSLLVFGIFSIFYSGLWIAISLVLIGLNYAFHMFWLKMKRNYFTHINVIVCLLLIMGFLTQVWMPLGVKETFFSNYIFILLVNGIILGTLFLLVRYFSLLLNWFLDNKIIFFLIPLFLICFGTLGWLGFDKVFSFLPQSFKSSKTWTTLDTKFPGLGKEFMPSLDEGSFLYMPTTMPHSGVEENVEIIRTVDGRIANIPEVELVVGKWGRVNSALDPAPISMFENIIICKPEYISDEKGHRMTFKVDEDGAFILRNNSKHHPGNDAFRIIKEEDLIQDDNGRYFRQWRKKIKSANDIWIEITKKTQYPGLTSAPKLQPIQTRLVMLQTGMRAPMGIKVYGPNLESIEGLGNQLETNLKQVEGVNPQSVFADRVIGKPYIEIDLKREELARYGLTVVGMQKIISTILGGMPLSIAYKGRERIPIRLRYARELRDTPEDIAKILITTPQGQSIPLQYLADIIYAPGPQMIKSENTFLVSYVIFDKEEDYSEIDVVVNAKKFLQEKIKSGDIKVPAGVSYVFTGNYENQVRATKRLSIILPISLLIIFFIIYYQFKSVTITFMIFLGMIVSMVGGFIMLYLYGLDGFLDMDVAQGINLREIFHVDVVNISVAVWVGFITLFGITTDNGVLVGTYLQQRFKEFPPTHYKEIRANVMYACMRRVKPAMMTTATTLLALLPILSSSGRGSDVMIPIAIPTFGGMLSGILTLFMVPILFCMWKEYQFKNKQSE